MLRFNTFALFQNSYVDTCKYDSNDVNISCKHVKSSLELCSTKATTLKINDDILRRIQMNDGKKKKLLALNRESELTLPLVQRINQRVFVVRCDISINFPTGLLHLTCNADAEGAQ